ncbi:YCF48-related protein [Sphingobacterium paucimobilis]|uniref:Photosynthesis system II assembly factor Ycf48/Hcf136-like domain-containing protein n=1 Tax=Sphingobacterium paucimobilis HER1398 TaxID=1346330 RepID=U2HV67_9SPHI|nr:YCF48-related protein [Sphingobacterium paucimobilis]ERJ59165.1 hypothetical protein M472_10310 [Sphingobacterium paucimobilis HER1398]
MKRTISLIVGVFGMLTISFAQTFVPLVENKPSSFRGLATYGKETVWVSGSKGTVGYSNDKGKSWKWVNPMGYENNDFRDIAIINKKEALIMGVGSPAIVLKTKDAGKTWTKVYEDNRPDIFLDDLTLDGKTGYILGDPIDGSFQLLKTTDKGDSWKDVSNEFILFADSGEAAFAASGSSMKQWKERLYIGTGGRYASFFDLNPKALRVDKYDCPIVAGKASAGIFAIDFINPNTGIAVGGDYLSDQDNSNSILLTNDAGKNWFRPDTPVLGYRSDVCYITEKIVLATGTSGTDISYDGGMNWKNISQDSFNTISKSPDNKTIYLTGSNGNIFKLIL